MCLKLPQTRANLFFRHEWWAKQSTIRDRKWSHQCEKRSMFVQVVVELPIRRHSVDRDAESQITWLYTPIQHKCPQLDHFTSHFLKRFSPRRNSNLCCHVLFLLIFQIRYHRNVCKVKEELLWDNGNNIKKICLLRSEWNGKKQQPKL